MLHVQELIKRYNRQVILKNLSVEFRTKCINVIIGPSGCGKTTLFNCISGLEPFEHGTVLLDGNVVVAANNYKTGELKQIGYVLQGFSLFSHLTVLNNLTISPRIVHKATKAKTLEIAHSLLKKMHLVEKQSFYPNQLSGGQQQRVAIARAIMMNPKILLLDEPTNALDPQLINILEDTLKNLISDGLTLIVSTHNLQFARRIADYSYFMHEGEMLESSEKANLLESYNPKIRHFIQEEEIYGI